MNSRTVAIFALAVALVVGGVMWFLKGDAPVTPPIVVSATPTSTPKTTETVTTNASPRTATENPVPPKMQEPPPAPTISDDDRKIDEVLRANTDNSDAGNLSTAQMLINLLPTLKPEGQAEAAQHISNLLPDKEYGRVAAIVKNPSAPQEVIDVFFTDLMNRDDTVKLPVLLDIAKIPNHPSQEEALTDLQIFLDGDFGTDWGKWDASMKAYLKKVQDESAPEPVAK